MSSSSSGLNVRMLATALVATVAAFGASVVGIPSSLAAHQSMPIYTDSLSSGWADWSWSTMVNWSSTAYVHSGKHSVAFTYTTGWDGLSLHANNPVQTSPYDLLRFWINGGSAGSQKLDVYVEYPGGGSGSQLNVASYTVGKAIQPRQWREVDVPLSALGAKNTQISRIDFWNPTAASQPTLYLDDLSLYNDGKSGPQPTTAVKVGIDGSLARHAISPLIYGVAWADQSYLKSNNLTVNRWGGDPTSRYNWRLGSAMNTAFDWYYENTNDGNSCTGAGCAVDEMVSADRAAGSASLITVPTLPWVAKNTSLDTCGFKVSKYGPQQETDPFRPNCGNGVTKSGKNITGNDPRDTSVKSTPADIKAWIQHLVKKFGPASSGGVKFFAMDNEPELWYTTHRDVAPKPLTYQGLYQEFESYATVVKQADPSASVNGPVPWGWSAYFDSSFDSANQTESDRKAHGNLPILAWFLKTVRQHDEQVHRRTLDVLDIHYYPQGNGVFSGSTDSATDALRLRQTRALWDPTYVDESWINSKVDLIPLMNGWISQYYPGTKLGISEWNFGADGSMNGALAIANVLGVYGKEGIYLASYWTHPDPGSLGSMAFDMYRNYDGKDHTFGTTSIQTTSGSTSKLMAFSALRSDHKVTVMLVNQEPSTSINADLDLKNLQVSGKAQVFTLNGSSKKIQQAASITAAPTMTVKTQPYSITLLVIPTKS